MNGTGKVPFARKICRHATGPAVRTGAGGAGNMRGGVPVAASGKRWQAAAAGGSRLRPVAGDGVRWQAAAVPARRGPVGGEDVRTAAAGGGFCHARPPAW